MADRRAEPPRGRIQVVYALPDRQEIVDVPAKAGMTIAAAVEQSGLLVRFPDIARRPLVCAIYGRLAPLTAEVAAGDRVEILRPLAMDPKESRRRAAARPGTRGAPR
ncbi:MAG TPA: RnfH family protein [Steroidobacter sp.]|nr:RnfH family protein [Steroidobacter sp.]